MAPGSAAGTGGGCGAGCVLGTHGSGLAQLLLGNGSWPGQAGLVSADPRGRDTGHRR